MQATESALMLNLPNASVIVLGHGGENVSQKTYSFDHVASEMVTQVCCSERHHKRFHAVVDIYLGLTHMSP